MRGSRYFRRTYQFEEICSRRNDNGIGWFRIRKICAAAPIDDREVERLVQHRKSTTRVAQQAGSEDIAIVGSQDGYLLGPRGKRFIDFTSGWCVGNFGWNDQDIRAAVRNFKGPTYVYPGYRYKGWDELAALLGDLAPGPFTRCFRATGGSEAVDLALQAAMVHTRRRKFISLEGSYHGNAIGGLSVGSGDRDVLPNLLGNCQRIKPPRGQRSADRVERLLKRRDVAALIMEPISINLGVLIPENGFLERVRELCQRYGTLFIADEVATGFGRTGKMFAIEHFNVQPDIICMAKAITGGHSPMGAMLTTAAVGQSMEKKGNFYSTYGWHPLSVAAAIATLRTLKRRRKTFLEQVNALSEMFASQLRMIEFGAPPKIRVKGLAIALEFDSEKQASGIVERAAKKGLLTTTEENTILVLPPLTMTRSAAAKGLAILRACAGYSR
jgi:acetylornithine/succinyldiaminopimelate/putrescine aminotransferase